MLDGIGRPAEVGPAQSSDRSRRCRLPHSRSVLSGAIVGVGVCACACQGVRACAVAWVACFFFLIRYIMQ